MIFSLLPTSVLAANKSVTITVRVYDQSTGQTYTVGTDTAGAGKPGQIQSADYKIPPLTKFVDASKFGKVTGVYGNWYFPSTINLQPGTTVQWSTNTGTGTMTYWVDRYDPNGGSSTSYLWNFTLKYNANGGTGAPADQTWGTNDKYTKSHTFNIPSTVPTREGYVFKGWSDTKGGSATRQPGGTCLVSQTVSGYNGGSVTKTLYAVWEKNTPSTPDKAAVPDILGNNFVKVTDKNGTHSDAYYSVDTDSIMSISDPVNNQCTVTIRNDEYITAYSQSTSTSHTNAGAESYSVILKYEGGKWQLSSPSSITFTAKCDAQPPALPEKDGNDIGGDGFYFECVTPGAGHAAIKNTYKAALRQYPDEYKFLNDTPQMDTESGRFYVQVEAKVAKYLPGYEQIAGKHRFCDDQSATIVLTFYYNETTKTWAQDTIPSVRVECAPSKPTETDVNSLNGTVKVTCMLSDREPNPNHASKTYALASGGYQINDDMKWDDTFGWIASITVDKNVYIQKYIDELKLPHKERGSLSSQIWLQWNESDSKWEFKDVLTDSMLEIPVKDVNKPDYDDLKDAIGKITVKDINTPDCGDKEYDLIANGTGGSGAMNWSEMRVNSDDGTAWKVVIHKAPYVEKYNGEMSYKEHVLVSDSKLELVVKYTAADGWKLASGQNAVIEVKHTATIPDPGANAFSNLKVQIKCDTKKDGSHDLQLSYSDGTYKFVRRTEPQYGYVVFTAADYLKTYNKTNPGHELKNAAAAVTWEFEYKDGKWQPRVDNKLPTIEVVCKDKPEIPSKTDVQLTTVKIQCVQPESAVKHNDSENAIAEAIGNHSNAYQLGAEVKQGTYNGETRYYVDCEITNITPYIADFNYLYSGHTEATEPEHVLKFKLWYCPENENVQGKHVWEADTVPTIYVKCEVAPSKPKDSDLNRTSYVEVVCDKNEHKTGTFTLSYGDYTVGNVEGDSQSGYTCTVTVKTEKYVNAYNETTNADNVKHVKVSEEVQLTFSYDAGTKTWKSDTKATIHTTHEKQDPKPDEGKIGDAIGDAQVMIQCEAKPSDHPTVEMRVGGLQNAQPNTSYQINGNIATVTINNPEAYAAEYKEGGADHTYKADGSRTTFTLKWSEDKEKGWGWYFEGAYALINTTCKTVTNQYTVYFDGNGGTGTMNSETVIAGSKYTLPACGFTAPSNKKFDGWEVNGTKYAVGASIEVNSNVIVKALWKDAAPAVTYLVTVKDSYAATTGEGRYEAGKTVTIHAGSRSNYRFDGWTTTSAGVTLASASSKNTTFVMPANVVTVTANWTYIGGSGSGGSSRDDSYTLRYDTNGGEKLSSESKTSKWTKDYEDLPIPTREGYRFDGWYYDSKLKNEVTGDVKVNTSVVTLYAGWTAVEVPSMLNGDDHFAYVQGYKDGMIRPYGLISRAETTTIFFRLLKDSVRDGNLLTSNTYTDVTGDYWANTAISTMTGLGIVQGRSADTFDPNAPITRAQFAAICARFDTGKVYGTQSFSDTQGHWAQAYIERAAELGWIKGFEDGTFRPDTYITRAQAMTMINRVLNRTPDDEDDLLDNMNVWPDCTPNDWFYLAVQEATNSHDFKYQGGEVWTKLTKAPDWSRYEH